MVFAGCTPGGLGEELLSVVQLRWQRRSAFPDELRCGATYNMHTRWEQKRAFLHDRHLSIIPKVNTRWQQRSALSVRTSEVFLPRWTPGHSRESLFMTGPQVLFTGCTLGGSTQS